MLVAPKIIAIPSGILSIIRLRRAAYSDFGKSDAAKEACTPNTSINAAQKIRMAFLILDLLGFPRIILKILGFKNLDSFDDG